MFQPELKAGRFCLNQCFECRVIVHPKILTVVTAEGTIVQCGDTVTPVAGYTSTEWLGRCLFDFLHPDERIEVIQKFGSLVENEVPHVLLDTRLAHRSGRWLPIEFSAKKIGDAASGMETIVVHLGDVEEKKRREALSLRKQNLDAIGDLAAGMAHEFNNVLTAIMGNISLAKHSLDAGDPAYQRLENAELASEKA
ncbi:MAG TPA: PAS domain S-box protein, partial [Nitrospiria bacterium]|nr:PAS domain S-box protein [Nitrospiria bacterium]